MDPNADDRVRPVPIEPGDGEASRGLHVEADPASPERARRPWLPLVIALSAIVMVFASISLFGAIQFEDPERQNPEAFASDFVEDPEVEVTTTTLPPSLEEMIPGVRDRLTVVTTSDEGTWEVFWDPAFRVPKIDSIDGFNGEASRPLWAAFDRGGRYVALGSFPTSPSSTTVVRPVGGSDETSELSAGYITWHSTELGRLAWTEFSEGSTFLNTGSVDPVTGQVDGVATILTIDGLAELTRFDRHGFILRNDFTRAFDPKGVLMWEAQGMWPASSNDSIVFVVDENERWLELDRLTGLPVEEQRLEGNLSETAFWVSTTEDTDLVARISWFNDGGEDQLEEGQGARVSMTVVGGGMAAPRIKQLDNEFFPVRFTRDGRFFVFTNLARTKLTFVDWRTGAEYTVPMPEGHTFSDFHLG